MGAIIHKGEHANTPRSGKENLYFHQQCLCLGTYLHFCKTGLDHMLKFKNTCNYGLRAASWAYLFNNFPTGKLSLLFRITT